MARTARTPGGPGFASRIIAWQQRHGRHGLPWQGEPPDPYRVWLSEVMLQQTQVATVLGYFDRFVVRYPDVHALAAAADDEVMALWAGLGYYSRARNLLRCAREVVARHDGRFPASSAALARLPGIGRSTAAAIAAFCFGERAAILDGNVRRVLARWMALDVDTSPAALARLWAEAEALLPRRPSARQMRAYTQGLMDLGATVCRPRAPRCDACPLRSDCRAHASGDPMRFPRRRAGAERPRLDLWLLWADRADGALWLTRRPATGIWAGLHALPVFDSADALQATLPPGCVPRRLPARRHDLTHRRLTLHPFQVRWPDGPPPPTPGRWVGRAELAGLGLPAPLAALLRGPTPGAAGIDAHRDRSRRS